MPSRRPNSALPPPSTQAAAKSEPVFSAHRSTYASMLVSGSRRWSRWSASPRARARDASASAATRSTEPVAARVANARANRWSPVALAAKGPCAVQAAARPRRRRASSTMSSWTSEAMCTSSIAVPSVTGGVEPGREERNVRAGRMRLPPAARASEPTAATVPGCASTTPASRSSTSSR